MVAEMISHKPFLCLSNILQFQYIDSIFIAIAFRCAQENLLTQHVFFRYNNACNPVAFHHSVNGKNLLEPMDLSRPNFSPKLEPIHRTSIPDAPTHKPQNKNCCLKRNSLVVSYIIKSFS